MNKSLAGIGLVLISTIGLFSCQSAKKDTPANMPVPVSLYKVQMAPATYYDLYPGTVTALSQVDLRAEVGGYITGIFFKEGEHIHNGQKLYEIDKSKYEATYSQAEANLQVALANEQKAQKDAERYQFLSKQDDVAKQTLDPALTDLQNAKSQVASAKADKVKALTDLRYSVIIAPFDGTIGLSQVKLGTLVTQGSTLLNTISTNDPTAVDFVISEKEVSRFVMLDKQKDIPADSLFTILMSNNSYYPFPGKLSVIDRAVDPQTGTIKIRLVFPNKDGLLRAGMSCTVRVHSQEGANQLLIPSKAITEQMGEYFAYVIDSQKAHQQKVMLGATIGPNVIIKSGLKEGVQIAVDGVQKLHDGSDITTSAKPAGPQGAAH
ncbi:MAG: efflux RND transporter periplasmic adaptor subunit [Bacteroidota bacterium]